MCDARTNPEVTYCGGCGRALRPEGPSPDFCNADCQIKWHQRLTTADDRVILGLQINDRRSSGIQR